MRLLRDVVVGSHHAGHDDAEDLSVLAKLRGG